MTGVYSFRPAPSYRGASRQELFDAALDEPLSMSSTFFDQAKAGVLESFGAGTAIRQLALPDAAPTEPGLAMQTPEGEAITLPDTPQMRRRQTVQGVNVPRETAQQLDQRRADVKALSEDQYKSSAYFRKDIPYDPGMTEDRAATLAAWYDAKKVREYYAEKRPITSFFGNLAGQALDPINYIPVAGPLVKAAAVAKFGRVGGNAAASALDAAANTAVFGLGTAGAREALGDDVSWQRMISEIATAALIGGAFGTVGGLIGRRIDAKADTAIKERLTTLKTTQEARVALNEAIDGLARGEDLALSPNATDPILRVQREITYPDSRARQETIDRLVSEDVPLGQLPKKPVTLMQFLASRSVGGIKDESGELAAMGLSRKFIPGGGALVTKKGKSLDYAREAAAEAGYFDHIYGDPDVAVAKSTPDDLLGLLARENGGEPAFSDRADGGRRHEQELFELTQDAQDQYRRVLDEVDGAIDALGIEHQLDDSIIRRAAEFIGQDKLDPMAALDRAIYEDYRALADAMDERGQGFSDEPDFDIPFFDDGPQAGGNVGAAGDLGRAGGRSRNAPDSGQPSRVGYNERQAQPIDTSRARPEPIPEGRPQAETRIAKPDDYKALAAQYRIDPENGSYLEEPEIAQVAAEGRLSDADLEAMAEAQATYDNGAAYGEALKAAVGCLI